MAVATAAKLAGTGNVMSMMPAVAAKEDIGACRRNNNAEPETMAAVNGRTSAGPSAVGTATVAARAGPVYATAARTSV